MSRRTIPIVFGCLALAGLLAACEDGSRSGARDGGLFGNNGILGDLGLGSRTIAYRCDDDRRFTADFDGARRVLVDADRERYDLRLEDRDRRDRRVYVGRENGEEVRLTVDGDDAYLRIPGGRDYQDCRART
jgi:hypothetical protein